MPRKKFIPPVSPKATPAATLPSLCYSITQAVQVTSLSRSLLYRLMGEGKLPYVSVGDRRLIPSDALHALVSPSKAV